MQNFNFHSSLFIVLCIVIFTGCERTQCRVMSDDSDVSIHSDTIDIEADIINDANDECEQREQNVCGGYELLFFEPGDSCGSCSRGYWQCEETDFVCLGDCNCEIDSDCAENEWCSNNFCVDEGWAYIPSGSFLMGSPDDEIGRSRFEQEQHRVVLTQPFLLSRYELTIGEWRMVSEIPERICNDPYDYSCRDTVPDPYEFPSEDCNPYPINEIFWFEALEYVNARSEQEGLEPCYILEEISDQHVAHWNRNCLGYRLPTEAEWEYAARAGTTAATHQGNLTMIEDEILSPMIGYAWCFEEDPLPEIECSLFLSQGSRIHNPHLPGLLPSNSWGLYDTLGNVYEQVWDEVDDNDLTLVDPPNYSSSQARDRLERGGCRFAINRRFLFYWNYFYQGSGIRLARSLPVSQ